MKLNHKHFKKKLHNLEITTQSLALFYPKVPKFFIIYSILATDITAMHCVTTNNNRAHPQLPDVVHIKYQKSPKDFKQLFLVSAASVQLLTSLELFYKIKITYSWMRNFEKQS